MTLSGIVICVCGLPWLISSFAAFQKVRAIYSLHPDLPPPRFWFRTPFGLRTVRSAAEKMGLDRVVSDLKTVARYRTIQLSMFTAMLGAFLFDFIRNVLLE